jgi:hypothetical protein
MKVKDLVALVRSSNEGAMGKMSDEVAAKFLLAALRQLNVAIEGTKEGEVLAVAGLGRFAVKSGTKKSAPDGDAVRRVSFRARAIKGSATDAE